MKPIPLTTRDNGVVPPVADAWPIIDADWQREVCRTGQGRESCRYVMLRAGGVMCAKTNPSLKRGLDARKGLMRAQGDNCAGNTTQMN